MSGASTCTVAATSSRVQLESTLAAPTGVRRGHVVMVASYNLLCPTCSALPSARPSIPRRCATESPPSTVFLPVFHQYSTSIPRVKGLSKLLRRRDVEAEAPPAPPRATVMSTQYQPPPGLPPTLGGMGTSADNVGGLSDAEVAQLVTEIKDYQIAHGSLLKLVAFDEQTQVPARPVAVSALPTPLPRGTFNEAMELQQSMCELYMHVAADEEWLYGVLAPLMQYDEFLSALWNVHLKVKEVGPAQDVSCGIFRSDYMVHEGLHGGLKQVEMNTFSAAGACHAERVANMHRHIRRVRKSDVVGLDAHSHRKHTL